MRFFALFVAFLSTLAHAYDRPESVYIHGKNMYVSNMSGPGNLKDGQGWISKLDRKGKVLKEKWIEGLNAPKGLGFHKGYLLVSDIDEVVAIDIAKETVKRVPVPGAKLLNDIVVDGEGNIYVSDTFGGKIFKITAKKEVEEFLTLKEAPNGLCIVGDVLWIAGYGKPKSDGTGMEEGAKGSVMTYDMKLKELTTVIPEIGKIDGIELLSNGQMLISVKGDEALYWIEAKKIVGSIKGKTSFADLQDVADMAYDAGTETIYLPNTNFHNIQTIKLK